VFGLFGFLLRLCFFSVMQRVQNSLIIRTGGGLSLGNDDSKAQAIRHYAKLSVNHTQRLKNMTVEINPICVGG
jgi:hypothetical protein